ncbi:type II toxin-antitoxin system RelE/ParE family toxin [Arthrobacter sp. UYEF20]|uniref:type II toxin-antitoxin system RelE family toxin n=1 Tax=Arthrobacter sp. UYEF20 TaxID=1756363 RepID=UPI0033982BAC
MGGCQTRSGPGVSYGLEVLPAAARQLRKLPPEARRRIQAAVELLAETPRPPGAKKLSGRVEWRVCTGDYRVLYRIDDGCPVIVVVQAGHRREISREA